MRFFKGVLAEPAFAGQELEKIYQKRSLEAVPSKVDQSFPINFSKYLQNFCL
jgi:hypothetical protein